MVERPGSSDSEFVVHTSWPSGPEPFLVPARHGPFAAYEEFGVEDPRVTRLEGEYVITYSAYSRNGVRIALARTKDFTQVERVSLITEADYRNVVIFPEKFDGLYAAA